VIFLNRESERILKKTAFLTVEDSLQLAAGIFNPSGSFRNNQNWNRSTQVILKLPIETGA
jgi:hypothetical protein